MSSTGALGRSAWRVATMVPGERPIERLAQALVPALELPEEDLLVQLRSTPSWAAEQVEKIGPGADGASLLLVIDQFEEAWTLSSGPDRATFFAALAAFAEVGPRVRLVATLRIDFLGQLEDLGDLRELALRAPVMLGPLSSEGLRRAIVEPARRRWVDVEPALADALVERARGAAGMLPLLEFALGVLWERRDERARRVALADLDALGGLEGALATHADAALGRLPPRLRDEAKRMLLRLVTVERTRARREERDSLGAGTDARAALDALLDARLVVASAGEESTAYEVAHEVLVSGWPTLRAWLDEEAAAREVLERLQRAAAEWQRLGRYEGLLGASGSCETSRFWGRSPTSTRGRVRLRRRAGPRYEGHDDSGLPSRSVPRSSWQSWAAPSGEYPSCDTGRPSHGLSRPHGG